MEFLMTYGWAILGVMVVMVVLFYLGILNPKGNTPNQCSFPAGLTCVTSKVYANGSLYLTIGQGTGRTIKVTGVVCTMNFSYLKSGLVLYGAVTPIGSQTSAVVIASPTVSGMQVNCTDANNNPLTGKLGDPFNGKLYVNYTEADTGAVRTVAGILSTKYEV